MRCFPLAIASTSRTPISSRCDVKDGTFVAAFSAQGATREGIIEAAMQDSRNLADPDTGTAHEGEDS